MVQYNNGTLSGDRIAVKKAQAENVKNHGELGHAPSSAAWNYLSGESSAYDLVTRFVFDTVIVETNDW
jgi:hypothetical protein